MIYTCYDMVRDCRAGNPEGWSFLVSQYVPVVRRILAHYLPEQANDPAVERILQTLRQPQSGLFDGLEPAPERTFIATLRQHVLAVLEEKAPEPGVDLDLEILTAAFEPLTLVEKLAVWLETMRYSPAGAGPLLRMDPRTVEKIRAKAGDLLRGKLDTWSRTVLSENGRHLGRRATSLHTNDCLPVKAFLDVLDGRTTWSGREEMERHVRNCWYCVDHFCRMVEVAELLRGLAPLSEAESARFRSSLGITEKKKPLWKRWVS